MVMDGYFADVAKEMSHKSRQIRRDFAQHRLSAGENREELVRQFLVSHLPNKLGIDTGFVVSPDGLLSNQADLVIVDQQNNAPLYPDYRNKLWPVESVYALVEVKTHLNPDALDDAISKAMRFKSMPREFCRVGPSQRIVNSLFVIWAFQSPEPKTVKENIVQKLIGIPISEQPDLVVVPDVLVASMGQYRQIAKLGEPNSPYRRELEERYQGDLSHLSDGPVDVYDMGGNSLLTWYVWFDSWLRQAGSRFCDPLKYLPADGSFGTKV